MQKNSFSHRPPRAWNKISIVVPTMHSDSVAFFMAHHSKNGIEQISVKGETGIEFEQIVAYLPEEENSSQSITAIQAFLHELNQKLPSSNQAIIQQERILEEDWNQRWKEHFKPFKLTDRLVIKPSWEEYDKQPHEIVLEMDPGMAFGTGLHASTQLALLLIEESFAVRPAKTVLDIGTGTGILGMDCVLLGAEKVIGLDNDIDACNAAIENIKTNKLDSVMTIDSRELGAIKGRFDLVIANITQDVLTMLAPSIREKMEPIGRLVLSGILTGSQTDSIIQVYGDLGISLIQTKSKEEWTALLFERAR